MTGGNERSGQADDLRKRAEERELAAQESLAHAFETIQYMVVNLPLVFYRLCYETGEYDFMSPRIEDLTGVTAKEALALGRDRFLDRIVHPDDRPRLGTAEELWERNKDMKFSGEELKPRRREFRTVANDGRVRFAEDTSSPWLDDDGKIIGSIGTVGDITERKQAENRERLARGVLEFLNGAKADMDMIRDILLLIKKETDMEAVGIRLREGDDFPYYETNGFPDEFVCAERYLCAYSEDGKIIRDEEGTPVLECMCGNVLCGRTDSSLPFFTRGGSFWSNCTTELLATTTEADRQARTRNRCNGEGYESVALIPLRSGDEIIGLLQLNDRRPNRFTPEMIRFFEGLGASIGIALSHKQLEEALKDEAVRRRILVEQARDGIVVLDMDGKVFEANNRFAELLGYSAEEILQLHMWDWDTQWTREHLLEMVRLVDEAGDHFETRHRRKDGGFLDVEISTNGAVFAGKKLVFCVCRDISERKRAEEALRKEKAFTENLIETAQTIVMVLDTKGNIVHFNRFMEKVSGYELSEIQGREWFSTFLPEGDRSRIKELFLKSLDGIRTKGNVNAIITKDGRRRDIEWYDTTLKDDSGDVVGILSTGQDVTERKQAEEEIIEKNDALEAALAVKNEFLSMVSHELRAPLIPILGYSELLLDGALGPLSPKGLDAVKVIRTRAEDLTGIISDLLKLGRLDHGKLQMNIKPLYVMNIALGLVNDYRSANLGKTVNMKCDGGDFQVLADAASLNRVLRNLIDNAVKYAGDSVDVLVRTEVRGQHGCISVTDNGIGISSDQIVLIFDRFYQVEQIDTRRHGGVGLGLSIARELVEAMNGKITVQSSPGRGSTFTVEFPIHGESAEAVLILDSSEIERQSPSAADPAAKTVIVIDDDRYALRLAEDILYPDYKVLAATDGESGLKLAQTTDADLILLDWMMPGMDGMSVLKALKDNDATRKIPVVFLSGKVEKEAINQVLDAGARDYVTKPFTKERLLRAVEMALSF